MIITAVNSRSKSYGAKLTISEVLCPTTGPTAEKFIVLSRNTV